MAYNDAVSPPPPPPSPCQCFPARRFRSLVTVVPQMRSFLVFHRPRICIVVILLVVFSLRLVVARLVPVLQVLALSISNRVFHAQCRRVKHVILMTHPAYTFLAPIDPTSFLCFLNTFVFLSCRQTYQPLFWPCQQWRKPATGTSRSWYDVDLSTVAVRLIHIPLLSCSHHSLHPLLPFTVLNIRSCRTCKGR